MSRNIIRSLTTSTRRLNTPQHNVLDRDLPKLPPTEKIVWPYTGNISGAIDIDEFKTRAFIPELPILITCDPIHAWETKHGSFLDGSLGAVTKWFSEGGGDPCGLVLFYLEQFENTILPYELVLPANPDSKGPDNWNKDSEAKNIKHLISQLKKASPSTRRFQREIAEGLEGEPYDSRHTIKKRQAAHSLKQFDADFSILHKQASPTRTFHHFNAPLSLFLHACQSKNPLMGNLYIAQAQLADLPRQLREDLPTPNLVLKAGKGDIYDSNLWLGLPPTYTPLHKDPNPNLLVQLAGSKRVRLFPPNVGKAMFRLVQERVRGGGNASFRGEEMMEGSEREVLDELVWGEDRSGEGREVVVERGEALFIPKGWWHCVRSEGEGVNGSVNWWFR